MSPLVSRLRSLLPDHTVLSEPSSIAPFLKEQRGRYDSHAAVVVLPETVEQVQTLVRAACSASFSLVPQGGNTGLVGGTVALNERQVIVNLGNLNRIRSLDSDNFSITVDAGCTLQQVKDAAAAVGLQYPLGLSVTKEAQIGGTLSTNAGGLNALRFGTARTLALGIEAVLSNGMLCSTLTAVRKNNQGLDVKQLFVGSEGTLGIITGACLQLVPAFAEQTTIVVCSATPQTAIAAYRQARFLSDDRLVAAELLHQNALRLVEQYRSSLCFPYPLEGYPWVLLLKMASYRKGVLTTLPDILADTIEKNGDAVAYPAFAEEEDILWAFRREIPWVQRDAGASIKHDIALPLSNLPDFLKEAAAAVMAIVPDALLIPFGHLGDGNIHYNIQAPAGMDATTFLQHRNAIQKAVLDIVHHYKGTFSAEHGIGLAKKEMQDYYGDLGMRHVQKLVKTALDRQSIFQSGK
jgi:FAD/FMN-containing dehydrogenase